jgi:hypothetical protein
MQSNASFTHADVDRRIRQLVEACILKIDRDPALLAKARIQVGRWANSPLRKEWDSFLSLPWTELREKLREETEEGNRIRQSAPFGGFLTNRERMDLLTGG